MTPAAFQAVDEVFDDRVGDVAIDAGDTAEGVAEALGLGDLGDAIFDEPRLVGMAEVVEVQPGVDRAGALGGVAGDGGEPDPAAEPAEVEQSSVRAGLLHPSSPGGGGRAWLRRLGGCVDLEPPVPTSTGRRLPGSGSRRR